MEAEQKAEGALVRAAQSPAPSASGSLLDGVRKGQVSASGSVLDGASRSQWSMSGSVVDAVQRSRVPSASQVSISGSMRGEVRASPSPSMPGGARGDGRASPSPSMPGSVSGEGRASPSASMSGSVSGAAQRSASPTSVSGDDGKQSKEMTKEEEQKEKEEMNKFDQTLVRRSLMDAVCRGRKRLTKPVVNPVFRRTASPLALEVQSSPSSFAPCAPPLLEVATALYSSRFMLRYHGGRCQVQKAGMKPKDVYEAALVEAWRGGSECPYLLDNLWDLVHLVDYLVTRPDVNPAKIGITGTGLGGMHAWLASVLDVRIAAAAPTMGVSNHHWSLAHRSYRARVEMTPKVFTAAAGDMGRNVNVPIEPMVAEAVWNKLAPGGRGCLEQASAWTPPVLRCTAVTASYIASCLLPRVLEAFQAARSTYVAMEYHHLETKRQLDLVHEEFNAASEEADTALEDSQRAQAEVDVAQAAADAIQQRIEALQWEAFREKRIEALQWEAFREKVRQEVVPVYRQRLIQLLPRKGTTSCSISVSALEVDTAQAAVDAIQQRIEALQWEAFREKEIAGQLRAEIDQERAQEVMDAQKHADEQAAAALAAVEEMLAALGGEDGEAKPDGEARPDGEDGEAKPDGEGSRFTDPKPQGSEVQPDGEAKPEGSEVGTGGAAGEEADPEAEAQPLSPPKAPTREEQIANSELLAAGKEMAAATLMQELAELERVLGGKQTIAYGYARVANGKMEISTGMSKYLAGRKTVDAGKAIYAEGQGKLDNDRVQAGKATAKAGKSMIEHSEAFLINGGEKLNAGRQLISQGLAEVEAWSV
eukprot:gene11081-18690_t